MNPIVSLQDQPEFVKAFSRTVFRSAGKVCKVCGLERMGHAPESRWLGHDPHEWNPIAATDDMLARARALTATAYANRH